MGLLLQTLVFGVLLGSLYALASSGLSLTFGVLRIVNLVHGSLLITGGYLTYTLWSVLGGLDPIVCILLTTPMMGLIGWALYTALIRPTIAGGDGGTMMATFAVMIAAEGIFALVWGNTPLTVAPPYARTSIALGDLVIPHAQLYAAIVALVVLGALGAVLRFTKLGRSIRAAASNPAGARLVGIRVSRVNALTYAIGAATAGAGGALISVIYPLTPDSWGAWLARGLAIVALGGMGSFLGTFVAALLFGVAETLVTAYVSLTWTVAVPYVVIIAVLIFKPRGLFGARGRTDVSTP